MTRKGFTLVELLILIVVLPSVMVVISGIFATFLRDVPRDTRLLQQNTSVLNMTSHLARDMDRAEGLPDSVDALRSDDHTLLIQWPERLVCYQLHDGGVTRTALPAEGQTQSADVRTWQFRDAEIAWQCRRQGDSAYAVELRTHLRRRVAGHVMEKLANSHVYFVDALGKAREIE